MRAELLRLLGPRRPPRSTRARAQLAAPCVKRVLAQVHPQLELPASTHDMVAAPLGRVGCRTLADAGARAAATAAAEALAPAEPKDEGASGAGAPAAAAGSAASAGSAGSASKKADAAAAPTRARRTAAAATRPGVGQAREGRDRRRDGRARRGARAVRGPGPVALAEMAKAATAHRQCGATAAVAAAPPRSPR